MERQVQPYSYHLDRNSAWDTSDDLYVTVEQLSLLAILGDGLPVKGVPVEPVYYDAKGYQV
ncbi:uncharacterized protein NFIA_004350 [Aspergillus fischeri NRRL 181]|uniref:Uncharacterized protein n=1 Tax=Neosartorya fischeri (strain ATCC 1020 / DSM 3700 / CBS 544.65 / FGSC A1164 / JCM 1740 / NRRL 181 / WB 181) TaxID=331117 RepID=A1DK40_NEOFI|nr:uncharacterized protein NFIA_004350 [Aspergillus fischeri NRRL 181]EAW17079.1 hypothetical protein NFIA_004350 [Aspergillus fischeri NRRL 181]